MKETDVLIIGGGASGLLAAGRAAQMGASVLLLEKNKMVGRKIRISGKGRCNITNAGDIRHFIEQYPSQGPFLYSAFNQFFNDEICDILESQGVALKVERGNRIFPESDDANQVVDGLEKFATEAGARIWTNTEVVNLQFLEGNQGKEMIGAKIITKKGEEVILAKTLVIATGGLSYPLTGSTGDGYEWAKKIGHQVTDLRPALVPLETTDEWVPGLSGLTLKNVEASLWQGFPGEEECLRHQQGEMLFTHFGVTGPIILTISRDYPLESDQPVRLRIDLKPALSPEKLDKRLQRDFEKYQKKQLKNALNDLLPKALIPIVIQAAGVDPETGISTLTREERGQLVTTLKGLILSIKGTRPMAEAIITAGGVVRHEIQPKTMASKKRPGIYFAGEIIDIDGYTGGYNLQAAFSTGWVAGESAARYVTGATH